MDTNLVGSFHFEAGKISDNIRLFKIKQRFQSDNKPSKFLVACLPDGSEKYISSLYVHQSINWTLNEQYQFDWNGTYYLLTIDSWNNQAEIKQIGTKKGIEAKKREWGASFGKSRRKPNNPVFYNHIEN
jgi:hypothetical protein